MQTCSGSLLVWILAEINDDTHLQGFFQNGAGLRLAPPPPWICWEFYFTCKSIINDTVNGKLCLCKNNPRFHQIASNKRSKFKISQGSMPPSLPHALHMDTYLPPPPLNNLILPPPWAKSWKKPCICMYAFICCCLVFLLCMSAVLTLLRESTCSILRVGKRAMHYQIYTVRPYH